MEITITKNLNSHTLSIKLDLAEYLSEPITVSQDGIVKFDLGKAGGAKPAQAPKALEQPPLVLQPTSLCKNCKAEIVWMKTINRKSIPVNVNSVKRDAKGNYPTQFDRKTMTTHFKTCTWAQKEQARVKLQEAASRKEGYRA